MCINWAMSLQELMSDRGYAGTSQSGIYQFTLFNSEELKQVVRKLDHVSSWQPARVNKMADQSGMKLRSACSMPLSKVTELMPFIKDRLYQAIRQFKNQYSLQESLKTGECELIRYIPGDFVRLHADQASGHEDREYSILVYLNDDYEGGETVFPMEDLTVRPRAGQMIIFPSKLIHESTELKSGIKYVALVFLLRI